MISCRAAMYTLLADVPWQHSLLIGEASASPPHGQEELTLLIVLDTDWTLVESVYAQTPMYQKYWWTRVDSAYT